MHTGKVGGPPSAPGESLLLLTSRASGSRTCENTYQGGSSLFPANLSLYERMRDSGTKRRAENLNLEETQ